MSDTPDGPGSWQASNGKWYPAALHPDAQRDLPPPPAPPQPQFAPVTTGGAIVPPKKSWWRRWWVIVLGVLVLLGVIATVASPADEDADPDTTVQPAAAVDAEADDQATGDEDRDDDARDAAGAAESADEAEPVDDDGEGSESDSEAEPEPEQPTIGTRDQPFAIGTAVPFTLDGFGDADRSNWTLTVDGPGADITRAVLDENPFNDPPGDGLLFYGVPVTLRLDGAEKEPLSPLFNINVEFFGPVTLEIISDGLSEGCGVVPDELDILKEVFVGGSISGMVCYAVTPADAEAGILLTIDEIEGDRIFFATVPGVGQTLPDTGTAPTLPPITTTPPTGEPDGSRAAPHPVGTPVSFTLDGFGDADRSTWTLTVDGPGADITQAVLAENQFNDPPEDGLLFYGVPVTLTLDSAEKEPLSPLFNISLEYFGPSTLEIISDGFEEGCGVTPDELDPFKEVFVGGSISGTICYSVTAADAAAGILVTLDEIEGGRLFLSTS